MSTSRKTVESLSKALALLPEVSFLPMMGDYCVYSRKQLFAMVFNDELFIKTTPETLCLFRDQKARPYSGNTNMCRANAEWLENPEQLGEVVLYTLASHPLARPPCGPRSSMALPEWFERFHWGAALGAGAALAALYFLLPYGALRAIGVHRADKAENFEVKGLRGEKIRLSDCAGKPVLLYVWESNSQRAIDNLPMIDSLYAAYKEREVCFLPVTITADYNLAVRAFAATMRLKYPVYNGAARESAQLRPERSPMLYLIDHEGYIRDSYSPSLKDQEKIKSDLEGLLK